MINPWGDSVQFKQQQKKKTLMYVTAGVIEENCEPSLCISPVCVMWRRHAVIMSVFLQGTGWSVNAVMEVSFYLSTLQGQVCSSHRAHASKPIVFCEDVWRVSTILGSQWARRKVLLLRCVVMYVARPATGTDRFCCSFFSESSTSVLKKSAGREGKTLMCSPGRDKWGDFTNLPSRGKAEQQTLHQT